VTVYVTSVSHKSVQAKVSQARESGSRKWGDDAQLLILYVSIDTSEWGENERTKFNLYLRIMTITGQNDDTLLLICPRMVYSRHCLVLQDLRPAREVSE